MTDKRNKSKNTDKDDIEVEIDYKNIAAFYREQLSSCNSVLKTTNEELDKVKVRLNHSVAHTQSLRKSNDILTVTNAKFVCEVFEMKQKELEYKVEISNLKHKISEQSKLIEELTTSNADLTSNNAELQRFKNSHSLHSTEVLVEDTFPIHPWKNKTKRRRSFFGNIESPVTFKKVKRSNNSSDKENNNPSEDETESESDDNNNNL